MYYCETSPIHFFLSRKREFHFYQDQEYSSRMMVNELLFEYTKVQKSFRLSNEFWHLELLRMPGSAALIGRCWRTIQTEYN